jgi:uncharacterized integral membrane protein
MSRRLLAAMLFLLLTLLCAGFARLNRTPVDIELFFQRSGTTLGRALVVAFVVGWLVGAAGGLAFALKLTRERAALGRALRLAESELRTLKATQPAHAR